MKGIAALSLFVAASLASAGTISIQAAFPSDEAGNPISVRLGESFYMTANLQVSSGSSYRVRFDLPYASRTSPVFSYTGAARVTWGPYGAMLASIPVDVSVESAGPADTADRLTVQVQPILPNQGIEYFDPQRLSGSMSATATLAKGTASNLTWYAPTPTTDGFQQVLSAYGSGVRTISSPYGQPVLTAARVMGTNEQFNTIASSSRVNPDLLRLIGWGGYRRLSSTVSPWLKPETGIQSTSRDVSLFVRSALPANFKTTMQPYEVAQNLFQAVVARLDYVVTSSRPDAISALRTRRGDCGFFAAAFVAACRNVGIPARTLCGFTMGSNQWHVWAEFYLPGAGWIPADPAYGDGLCPDGSVPVYFGTIPELNQRVATTYGYDHVVSGRRFPMMQSPAVYFSGGARLNSVQAFCSLSVAG